MNPSLENLQLTINNITDAGGYLLMCRQRQLSATKVRTGCRYDELFPVLKKVAKERAPHF